MLSDYANAVMKAETKAVLILVVMEDALWLTLNNLYVICYIVLILVVMEDALWLFC